MKKLLEQGGSMGGKGRISVLQCLCGVLWPSHGSSAGSEMEIALPEMETAFGTIRIEGYIDRPKRVVRFGGEMTKTAAFRGEWRSARLYAHGEIVCSVDGDHP